MMKSGFARRASRMHALAAVIIAVACTPFTAPSATTTPQARQAAVDGFIRRMVSEHGFDSASLNALFAEASTRQSILDAISRPAEKAFPWHKYRDIFMTTERIDGGVEFWREHRDTLNLQADGSGVPPSIVVAILGVETRYGDITGKYRVIDALSTLAFDYPPRSPFFTRELEQFLLLTREEAVDPLSALGSYAGAMGGPQFMPSSYRHYAVDFNGDGRRDLWSSWPDIIGSVSNYFTAHGWRPGEPVVAAARLTDDSAKSLITGRAELKSTVGELRAHGVEFNSDLGDEAPAMLLELETTAGPAYWVGFRNFYVITRYNRSVLYAMAVNELGEAISLYMEDDDAR